eukprot:15390977-Alexandrium_andersonii.AAC.1
MSASLVGSEMCIRDRTRGQRQAPAAARWRRPRGAARCCARAPRNTRRSPCLLYTSDAADDM